MSIDLSPDCAFEWNNMEQRKGLICPIKVGLG